MLDDAGDGHQYEAATAFDDLHLDLDDLQFNDLESPVKDVRQLDLVALDTDVKLGFQPSSWPPEDVLIQDVIPGSWADRHGLTTGDALVTVQGTPVTAMNKKMLKGVMRERPLSLVFERRALNFALDGLSLGETDVLSQRNFQNSGTSEHVFDLVANGDVKALGFWPWGFPPDAVLVHECELGSWAESQGLQAGDELVSVNGGNVRRMTGKQIRKAMKVRPLQMTFLRKPGALEDAAAVRIQKNFRGYQGRKQSEVIRAFQGFIADDDQDAFDDDVMPQQRFDVIAEKSINSLGFSPWGLPPAVFVHECVPDSWAVAQGVRAGDELVSVDGQEIKTMTAEQLRTKWKTRPLHLTFVRREGALDEAAAVRIQKVTRGQQARKEAASLLKSKGLSTADFLSNRSTDVNLLDPVLDPFEKSVSDELRRDISNLKSLLAFESEAESFREQALKAISEADSKGLLDVEAITKARAAKILADLGISAGQPSTPPSVKQPAISSFLDSGNGSLGKPELISNIPARPIASPRIGSPRIASSTLKALKDNRGREAVVNAQSRVEQDEQVPASDGRSKEQHEAAVKVQSHYRGRLDRNKTRLSALDLSKTHLQISIISARDLGFGTADPVCQCIVQGRADVDIKTRVAKTVNPEWNHQDVITNYTGGAIEFVIWDVGSAGILTEAKKDGLGKARLFFKDFYPHGFHGDLKMTESRREEAALKVKVVVVGQGAAQKPNVTPGQKEHEQRRGDVLSEQNMYAERQARQSLHLPNTGSPLQHPQPQPEKDVMRKLGDAHHEFVNDYGKGSDYLQLDDLGKSSDYLQKLGLLRAEYDIQRRKLNEALHGLERESDETGSANASQARDAMRDVTVLLEDCFATAFRAIAASQAANSQNQPKHSGAEVDASVSSLSEHRKEKRRHGLATASFATAKLWKTIDVLIAKSWFKFWRLIVRSNRVASKATQSAERQAEALRDLQLRAEAQARELEECRARERSQASEHAIQLEKARAHAEKQARDLEEYRGRALEHAAQVEQVHAVAGETAKAEDLEAESRHSEEVKQFQDTIRALEFQQAALREKLRKAEDQSARDARAREQFEEHAKNLQTQLDHTAVASLATIMTAQKFAATLWRIYRRRIVSAFVVLRSHRGQEDLTELATPVHPKVKMEMNRRIIVGAGKTGGTLERLARARAMMHNAAWEHGLDTFAGGRALSNSPRLPTEQVNAKLIGQIQELREYVDETDDRAWRNTSF